jgi:NAD+ kinase
MKLYLYYGTYTAKADVQNISNRLKEKGHIIRDSFSDCDLILSLGGDGTLLKAAQHAIACDKPLAGINCGRLGYLCLLKQEEIDSFDEAIKTAVLSEKILLKCEMNGASHYAINDVTAGKTSFGKTVDLSLSVGGHFRYMTRCDGLIVTTPVGSSAYNLAAFGPLLDDDAKALAITPICSHTRDIHPLIVRDDKQITITVNHDEAGIFADGEYIGSIADSVTISKADKTLKLFSKTQ